MRIVRCYFRPRRSMNFANAIPPKRKTHTPSNTAMLFVGVGTFSGSQGTRSKIIRAG
jgi:hypothetical protein